MSNCPCAALIREPHEKRNELSSEKELRPTFSKLRWLATAAHIFYCFFVPSQSAVGVCARPPYKSDEKHPKNGDLKQIKSQEKPENRHWEQLFERELLGTGSQDFFCLPWFHKSVFIKSLNFAAKFTIDAIFYYFSSRFSIFTSFLGQFSSEKVFGEKYFRIKYNKHLFLSWFK